MIGLEATTYAGPVCPDNDCTGSNWVTLDPATGDTVLVPFVMNTDLYDSINAGWNGGCIQAYYQRTPNWLQLKQVGCWGNGGLPICQRDIL